ncbi:MAG TPA: Rne/Rng family ribonuclease [Isosphaeraceae bacterium]|jgi:ribonuclease E|nr:Rne/Rng family ribonuclease [Isosphaeraceae bacterium]
MKKEMLINVLQPEECRIAIVEDGVLEELYVERTSHESYTGNIYKGKVVNLEPAIQAAFVDFSVGRNGFLHVSDVEPRYYRRLLGDDVELGARDRGRDPRRLDPEDRPRSRDRARDRGPGPDRGEDRADRSERGRRDRSSARRFGEGLIEDDWFEPPPPPSARPEPTPTPAPEPEPEPPPRPEPSSRRDRDRGESSFGWGVEPPAPRAPERERERERPRGVEAEPEPEEFGGTAARGWSPRYAEPSEEDLPPSRTRRSRPSAPPPQPRSSEFDFGFGTERVEEEEPTARGVEPEPDVAPPEPRRGRGRGRGQRSARAVEPELGPIEDLLLPPPPPPAVEPDEAEEPPRRRGGRAAIRSRGGDRPAPATPRPSAPPPPPAIEPEPVEEPEPADEPEPPRPRGRGRSSASAAEAGTEAPRERLRPHGRAGEPGYVPRRVRTRAPEPDWFDPEAPPTLEEAGTAPEPAAEAGPAELDEGREGARRRRRRRGGRRRDREDVPEALEAEPSALEDEDLAPPTSRAGAAIDDFDFGDEEIDEEDEPAARGVRLAEPEEAIEPELSEEIRREVEEIAELERELGLRAPAEARPRRGEPIDREAEAEPGRPGARPRGRAIKPPIQEVFRRGDEVLVQVIKESIGTKGPTLSTYISIPGRYLVLMPGLNRVGVSRKIADEAQRRKLREIMNELNPPKGLGFIVRTAGLDRSKRELARDLAYLLRLWKVILRRIKKAKAPAPIYQESDMITRTIRDIFSADIDTIWIDEPQAFERAQEFLRVVMPKYVNRLKFYDEKVPLFHKYGIEDEISRIQRRQVPLPEGGSIVIDQTEALVAIDVNSGNFRVENDAERTAFEMNLRAAKEIARQLRLRDLGGVIVNDFIDMRDERNRRGVERALREAVQRDRARTKILRMSQFGIIEMTRQRIRPSLKRSIYEDCPHCTGAGVVKTVESMSIDVMRLLALAAHREEIRRVNVCVAAPVATYLNNRKRREIARIEAEGNLVVHIRHEEGAPAEHLQLDCYDSQNAEVRILPAPLPPPRRPR